MKQRVLTLLAFVPVALALTHDITISSVAIHPESAKPGSMPLAPSHEAGQQQEKNLRQSTKETAVNSGLFIREAHAPKPKAKGKSDDLEANVPGIIDENELEGDHALDSLHSIALHVVVPCSAVLLISMTFSHMLTRFESTKWIPDSAATLAIALVLGRFIRALAENGMIGKHGFVLGASTTLNLVLLPIIVFASGWSLRRADFIFQFKHILLFAICGTLISTFVIGYSSFALSNYFGLHVIKDFRSNMAFAALISAVDPVATLCTYKSLQVEPLLNIMVFGESMINDAVAIVLFSLINTGWDDLQGHKALLRMAQLLFGSMAYGLVLSGFLIWIMRMTSMKHNKHTAILYIWMSAYLVYGIAEGTHAFSGIIATLMAGIVFGAYGRLHLTEEGAAHEADHFFDLTCEWADKSVFVLCGAATAMITSTRGWWFGCISVALCLFGRACSVVPCGMVTNAVKDMVGDPHRLSWRHLFMMWHGGLRGGIALVLALEIDAKWCNYKATIVNGTFITICVLLLVCGGSTELLLKKLSIPMGCTDSKWDALKPDALGPAQEGIIQVDRFLHSIMSEGGKAPESDGELERKTTLMSN